MRTTTTKMYNKRITYEIADKLHTCYNSVFVREIYQFTTAPTELWQPTNVCTPVTSLRTFGKNCATETNIGATMKSIKFKLNTAYMQEKKEAVGDLVRCQAKPHSSRSILQSITTQARKKQCKMKHYSVKCKNNYEAVPGAESFYTPNIDKAL